MPRPDELDEMKMRYKALLQRGETEPHIDSVTGSKHVLPINGAALAVMIVGARLARILIDLGMIMSVMVREQRWLRLITQGEVDRVVQEQQKKTVLIYKPGEGAEKMLRRGA